MPKQKKKMKKSPGAAGVKGQSGDDKSVVNDDAASTISNASTNMSYQQDLDQDNDDKAKASDDVLDKIDNIEEEISKCLDGLMEKGFKEREDALKVLKKIFSNKYLVDHLTDRRFTVTESLIRSLKRGKATEQVLALEVLTLIFVQFGYFTSENLAILSDVRELLLQHAEDEKLEPEVRLWCLKALGFALFITNERSADIMPVLDKLEAIFAQSYAKGDGTLRTFPTPKTYDLHSTALSVWCLLLTILPIQVVNKISQKHVHQFQDFLRSPDVDLRIVAGETIALLYELAQCDSHSDIACFKEESLLETLRTLASESSKQRSKRDRKALRHSFRDVVKALSSESGGDFEAERVKFGSETLNLDNWIRRKHYDMFRDALGPGINVHLAENEFMRELFDLGAPMAGADGRRAALDSMSRMQKAQFNKEAFRSRTRVLNKKRDTKGNVRGDPANDDS